MNDSEIYQAAIEKWGVATQVMMAMGEFGELIAALNRRVCQGRGTNDDVIDEIADAEIMLTQLRHIFGAERVDERRAEKLSRLGSILGIDPQPDEDVATKETCNYPDCNCPFDMQADGQCLREHRLEE